MTHARLLDCGLCYEENGEEVHPHPECPRGGAVALDLEQAYGGDPMVMRLREALIKAGLISLIDGPDMAIYRVERAAWDFRRRISGLREQISEMLSDKADGMHVCGCDWSEVQDCTNPGCDSARAMQSAADLVREMP